ncbi:MAG: quinone-dependent dihydroorotate dehydrogenase, partial [Ectothiorhodospiraceae bacterium]
MYQSLRRLLFALDPERAHDLTLRGLSVLGPLGAARLMAPAVPPLPVNVMGLEFRNPVGLAAGLDKNGDYIDTLAR